MPSRIDLIAEQIAAYATGSFDKRLQPSGREDEIDAIISGINMLGEELKAVTISRDFFNSIFHSVSDMVFLIDGRGIIHKANRAVSEQLQLPEEKVTGISINQLNASAGNSLFPLIRKQLKQSYIREGQEVLLSDGRQQLTVLLNAAYFLPAGAKRKLILVTARNITEKVAAEKAILRAIIDTQEAERRRLAQDLHDSLGQQLSAIRFFIASTERETPSGRQKKILKRSSKALSAIMTDMRNICFDLMPKTLEEFGLLKAIREFCNPSRFHNQMKFRISPTRQWPRFDRALEIDLYRLVQEFVSNSIRHGAATIVHIRLETGKGGITLVLQNNGEEFTPGQPQKGMGLQNMNFRVRSHRGTIRFTSFAGEGVTCRIHLPNQI
ncbi:PAS domain-containing sensor histidine kinase [Flavihumibacter petaseus]|uniref:Putative two-component histidine kinase n=1 Tax=Flavihumibacter petaseus NBRC 106054 TaxID=1220578 RepID=A0A0E9N6A4_9BACT|nr:histidine kinase [Flavihumibacter petaseus]GAO45246.1 putative two-component histidine kinase [Flavihumibacter petaseus NBRC 106054]